MLSTQPPQDNNSSSNSKPSNSTGRVLKAEGLIKAFGGRTVVNDVSFSVTSGQVVGLLGPNGAGKTTSFYMVVGLVRPDGGRVLLDDVEITHIPMHQRARRGVGYLAQEPSVFRKMTVEDNLLAVLENTPLTSAQRREALSNLLEDFNIRHVSKQQGYTLSGGERRRV